MIRQGAWGPWQPAWMLGHEVHGATLGIVGAGRIGRATAARAAGFGMRVLYASRSQAGNFPGERVDLDTLLRESHFVSVHVPLTDETRGMFDASVFARMRPDAIFINTARGGVVDQPALIDALQRGAIAGAGLDVMTPEPLPPHDPLLAAPHLGSSTEATRVAMAALAVDNLLAALTGERPRHLVNAEAWRRA
jgi:glyoxylate reductase